MAANAVADACVLPKNYTVSVLLLGENGVGKTSLVRTFVTGTAPSPDEALPAKFGPQEFRSDFAPLAQLHQLASDLRNVNLLLTDSEGDLGRNPAALVEHIRQASPDVVLLCYSHDDPMSLVRLADVWIPAIRAAGPQKASWPHTPICLCGTKVDRFPEKSAAEWRAAYVALKQVLLAKAPGAERALQELGLDGADDLEAEDEEEGGAGAAGSAAAAAGAGGLSASRSGASDEASALSGLSDSDFPLTPRARSTLSAGGAGGAGEATAEAAAAAEAAESERQQERKDAFWQRAMVLLISSWPQVHAQVEVSLTQPGSEGLVRALGDVLHRAIAIPMYPIPPLYAPPVAPLPADGSDEEDAAAAAGPPGAAWRHDPPGFVAAYNRMFRAYAEEIDPASGRPAISAAQMVAFCKHCHGTSVGLEDMAQVFAVMHAVAFEKGEDGGDFASADGRLVLLTGFRQYIYNNMVQNLYGDAWRCLRAHGYAFAQRAASPKEDAHQLVAWANDAGTASPAAGRSGGANAASAAAAAVSGSGSAERRGPHEVVLHMPPEFAASTALEAPEDASLTLSAAGTAFLLRIFRGQVAAQQAGEDGRAHPAPNSGPGGLPGGCLLPGSVAALFATTPVGHHPFNTALYPDVTLHNSQGGVTAEKWLLLWQMLLATSPDTALQALYALGFCTHPGGRLSFDPRDAVAVDAPRKFHGPNVRAAVRRVFVLGSEGCGKSTVILTHVCQGKDGLQEHCARIAADGSGPGRKAGGAASASASRRSGPAPTTVPTHYVVPPVRLDPAESAGAGSSAEAAGRAAREAALPDAVVITEWPASQREAAMEAAATQCDRMLLVVDSSDASLTWLQEAVAEVPDLVPVTVVYNAPDTRALEPAAKEEAQRRSKAQRAAVRALCGAVGGVGDGAAAVGAGGAAAAAGAAGAAPWGVQYFQHALRGKDAEVRELFAFVTQSLLNPADDNPQTPERRAAARWAGWRSAARVVGAGLAVAAVGVGVYFTVPAARERVDGLWRRWTARSGGGAGRAEALPSGGSGSFASSSRGGSGAA